MKARPLPGVNTSLVDVRGRIGRDWAREPGRLGPSRPGRRTAPAPALPRTVSQSRRDSGSRDKIASREGMHRGYCRRRAGSATAGPAHGLGLSSHTMLFVLDNYDSFTYNLVQLFGELGAEPVVYRNDALTVDQVLALKPTAAVLSPQGRRDHGDETPPPSHLRRPVPSRVHRHAPRTAPARELSEAVRRGLRPVTRED